MKEAVIDPGRDFYGLTNRIKEQMDYGLRDEIIWRKLNGVEDIRREINGAILAFGGFDVVE